MLAELVNTILNPFKDKIQSSLKDILHFKDEIPIIDTKGLPFIEII